MRLELKDLAFGHGRRTIGSSVTLALMPGEVLALLGPNGAGKTTLFKTVLGLLAPQKGEIALDGKPLSAFSRAERARLIAYVPQAHQALFPFTVRDVVLMGRAARIAPFATPGRHDRSVADEALGQIGIDHLADRPYTEISGGERQMALIARALTQEPKILVMDEPTASLDYGNQMRVLGQIRRLATQGIAVILSTHDPDHVFIVADRVAMLHDGRIEALGAPSQVMTEERMKRLYDVDVVIGRLPGAASPVLAPRGENKM